MKLFINHVVHFGIMFMITFLAISLAFMFIPLLMAFIAWDTSFIDFDWESVFTFIRLNTVVSMLMGLSYIFSKEGKAHAKGE